MEQKFATLFLVLTRIISQANILDDIDPNRIRNNLMELSSEPHIAGSSRDVELADWIEVKFLEFGINKTQKDSYDILMSYPDKNNPNLVQLLDGQDYVQFTSGYREEVLRPEDDHPNFVDAFLAFTPPGNISGQLVYVNYAREEDLDFAESVGVDIQGKIAIARYGRGHRGNKIKSCQERGALGVILFSDPFDVTNGSTDPQDVYPYTQFLPGSGIQRGTAKVGISGDVLSPGWASVSNAYRLPLEERQGVPSIPAQPIGYDDAKVLLEKLGGPPAPPEWFGGINIPYFIGGEFAPPYNEWSVKLDTHNIFDDGRENIDVVGIIPGSVEPDRYVIIANHRDAWGFGAVDPSSATAVLLEVARVFANEVKNGQWKPKRSLVFISWAAEEYGVIGSTEWVFEKMPKLRERAVAVINLDQAVYGPILRAKASPSLGHYPLDAIKSLSDPSNSSQSYYDFLKNWSDGEDPTYSVIGSGSDHDPFVFTAGIPVVYPGFISDSKLYPNIYQNPTYHTAYETFYLVDTILDPGFAYHRLLGQLVASMAMEFSDADVLDFKFEELYQVMEDALVEFEGDGTADLLEENGASLRHLSAAVSDFYVQIFQFYNDTQNRDLQDPLVRRMVNDQIMSLEHVFIADQGLPGRLDTKHLIYSPSLYNRYASSVFPGIRDLLSELTLLTDPEEIEAKWKQIRRHVSDLMIAVQQAANILKSSQYI